jgi:hypothetical protein
MTSNKRETGARKLSFRKDANRSTEVSQAAAENRKPPSGQGNSEPVDDTNDKTRRSDGLGVRPSR